MLRGFLTTLLLAVCCAAQTQGSLDRLPRPRVRILANGLQAIMVKTPGALRTVLQIRVPASSVNDFPGQTGVAEATARLLISEDLQQRLEDHGAHIEVAAPYGSYNTVFSVSFPSDDFKAVAALVFGAIARPQFTEERMSSWKKKRAAELEGDENVPSYLADSVLYHALYRDARQWAGPSPESLQNIDLDSVKRFYQENYAPCHSWVGVIGQTGDKTTAKVLIAASRVWVGCPAVSPFVLREDDGGDRTVYVLNRPLQQAYLCLGGLNVYRMSPDYPAAMVLNRLLGASPGGLLFQALRQKQGSTYDVRSSLVALKYLHHFSISVTVSPDAVEDSVHVVARQLESLRNDPLSSQKVNAAKSAMLGEFLRSLENSEEILDLVMTSYVYGLPDSYWQNYASVLDAVSPASVQAAANKYLNPQHMKIVAIGNGQILRSQLQGEGTLYELDKKVTSRK